MQQQVRHMIETHWYEYVGMNGAEKILRNCMLIGRTFPIVHELSIIVNINIEFQHVPFVLRFIDSLVSFKYIEEPYTTMRYGAALRSCPAAGVSLTQ